MPISPLKFIEKLEALLLQDFKVHEQLKDKALSANRFLDFNKKSILLELCLSHQEAQSLSFKSHIDVQQISGDQEENALNIRIHTPENHTERLALIKSAQDLEREIKITSLLFKTYFFDYLANGKLPNFPPQEGTLQSRVEKALSEAKQP